MDYDFSVDVEFGNVSNGDETARVGIKIDRDEIELDDCETYFCGRRVEAELYARITSQQSLEGMESDQPTEVMIRAQFDINGYRVSPKAVTAGLTVPLNVVDRSMFGWLARRNGTLRCTHVADLDKDDQRDNQSAFDEESTSDSLSGQKTFGTAAVAAERKRAGQDEAGRESIKKLGMTKGLTANVEAAGCKTIADLEEFIRTNEWWHRNIKGVGEEKVNIILDSLMVYRQQHPVPSDDDETEDEDSPEAMEEQEQPEHETVA
jgi:hypothetical protein